MDLETAEPVTVNISQLTVESRVVSNSSTILSMPQMAVSPGGTVSSFCRPLPPGKLYHVFFSYCSEDREWVRQMVEKLEEPEFGFKCCYDERDFDIGVPVFQNIMKCIHSSKRTVIVMSPEFLQSSWCSYETRIILELDLDTKQRLLIPVMLRSCEPPQYIGRLTYMEVQNEHFWGRFLAALQDDDSTSLIPQADAGSSSLMTGVPFQFNPHFQNTDEIIEVTVYQGCRFCSSASTEFVPNELTRNGLQVSQSEYGSIVTAVTRICYVRCHGCFNKSLCVLPIGPAFILAIVFTSLAISSSTLDTFTFLGLPLFVFAIALLVIYKTCTLRATRNISRAIEKANTTAKTRNLMVIVKQYGLCSCTCDKMAIIFYYYDWRPCHSHLTQFLNEKYMTMTDNEAIPRDFRDQSSLIEMEQGENMSSINQDKAWDLLVKHATEYCQLLLNRRTVTQSEQRHTRQGECLCQFVESILMSGETSCCDCIFGVRSRQPWRRYCLF